MPILSPDIIESVQKPELFFGLVGAVGAPLKLVSQHLTTELENRGYHCHEIKLSQFLLEIKLDAPYPDGKSEYERRNCLMDRGNELRMRANSGEILALLAASKINGMRENDEPLFGSSFILNQLKHPHEVFWLRKIYGSAFHLIGIYSSDAEKKKYLQIAGMTSKEIEDIIKRDEDEEFRFGQKLRDTFYLADVFIRDGEGLCQQLTRYLKLLFGELDNKKIITPSVDEYGMFIAYSASLRSGNLSRQVGAAILNGTREILSVGTNEVPCAIGGQYWPDSEGDSRDCTLGFDPNTQMKIDIIKEIIDVLNIDCPKDEIENRLRSTQIMNISEFGRSVHAEMEAILAAGRLGVSARSSTLFSTTFPCHNCAKHIVNAGIKRVVYIEPYPKSHASSLHNDSICFSVDENNSEYKVRFEPFIGVAPRKYWSLFSHQNEYGEKIKYKDSVGKISVEPKLRLFASSLSYIRREQSAAAAVINKFKYL
jgi:deoxycytidylate deaminase